MALLGVAFEEFLDIPLIGIRIYEAQDLEDEKGCCDVGDQEADAGPEGGVDEEGKEGECRCERHRGYVPKRSPRLCKA